jgi:Domain of unknown function (DUF3883)
MELAEKWLHENGYSIVNCSANQPFDFEVQNGGKPIKIEVKGTTSDRADAILMTKNEVDVHTIEKGRTGLIIISKIRLSKTGDKYEASGGDAEIMLSWDITTWEVEPTAFRLSRK